MVGGTDAGCDKALKDAMARLADGDGAAAERLLRGVLEGQPDNIEALYNLGVVLMGQGRAQEALPMVRRVVEFAPEEPLYLRILAVAQVQTGHTRRAMRTLQRLLELSPDDVEGRYLYATQHRNRGNVGETMEHLSGVLERDPDHLGALFDTGGLFVKLGQLQEAQSAFARAVQVAPDNADAWSNLGNVQMLADAFTDAIQSFEKALAFDETHAGACSGLIVALRRSGMPEASAERAEAFVERRPDDARLYNLLGTGLRESGRLASAREAYERASAIDPTMTTSRLNLAMLDLLEGHWQAGWPGYELRVREGGFQATQRTFAQPRWVGESLEDRTLLLYGEQGIGDTVQFARFVRTIVERFGGRVVLECQPTLKRLLETLPCADAVVAHGEPLPPFDVHLPLISVPGLLNLTPDAIPQEVPYLTAGSCPASLRSAIDAASGRKVGLVWRGNPEHLEDWKRSLPYNALAPLLALDGVTFVNLQVTRDGKQNALPDGAVDAAPQLADFADTAAVIAALDEVVCCDTAVAHVAGALDVPCRLMLPFVPDWRWGMAGERTPWYGAAMRLYRQPALHDWDSVIAAVAADIEEAL